jgi:hypothetical protein
MIAIIFTAGINITTSYREKDLDIIFTDAAEGRKIHQLCVCSVVLHEVYFAL